MNRQTVGVIGVTMALLLAGGVFLYGRPPAADEPVPAPVAAAPAAPAAKAGKGAKAPPARKTEAQRSSQRPIPEDRAPAPAGAPNVVVILMSTQRRDQWSVYGATLPTTPFLAEQARRGVVATDALAAAVDCPPGLGALITGRYPHGIGLVDPAPDDRTLVLSPAASSLAERFAAAGWHTIGLTATSELNRSRGGNQGFDVYVDAQEDSLAAAQRIAAPALVKAALARVTARKEGANTRPLYLQLAFSDSHKPQIRLGADEAAAYADAEDPDLGPYRATVRRQDDAVRALVEGLAEREITAENTVFVVVADHGEGLKLPARHRPQHGLVLYESSVAIPWVMWGEGIARGKTLDGLVSAIDLAPTLLGLAGAPRHEFDGLDLSALARKGGRSPRTEAYADTFLAGFHRASVWTASHQCQQDYGSTNRPGDDDFEPGCFDRRADPDFGEVIERSDLVARLAALHAERIAALPKAATTDP